MRPPESSDSRAGDIFKGIGGGVMKPVIRSPRKWRTRAIKHSKKDENLTNNRMQPERTMGKRPVIAHRRPHTAKPGENDRCEQYFPPRQRTNDQPYYGSDMNQDHPHKRCTLAGRRAPPRPSPGQVFFINKGNSSRHRNSSPLRHNPQPEAELPKRSPSAEALVKAIELIAGIVK
jgi:hypothetical protein